MSMRTILLLAISICLATSCSNTEGNTEASTDDITTEPTNKVVLSTEIKWQKLNPARGDKSPQAGTIWGDRNGSQATGFLAKFIDGFSSPPHIHNVTYRAIVLKGLVHNDDPDAEEMWMPAGSFWTQPAGEPHITAAKGIENIAYVEIDQGPYLVKPVTENFDNGERPVNVDKNNIVWLDATQTNIIQAKANVKGPEIAFLWESNNRTGKLLKLPAGFEGTILSEGEVFHAVVIQGESEYILPISEEVKLLDPGSYFTAQGRAIHSIRVSKASETIIYIRTNGKIHLK